MAQVTVRINGYAYTLACRDGEEQHLLAMAEEVDQRIEGIRHAAGQSGEARMLVMAALVLADDLYEARKRGEATTPPASAAPAPDPRLGRRLNQIAKRAEDIAADLEHP
jgi:cell division protein ZapA